MVLGLQNNIQGFIQAILMSAIRHENSILQLSFETQSSYTYSVWLFAFVFAYLLSYWNLFVLEFLAMKIKRYRHVSYMQLLDYLCMHNNIHNMLLTIQKIKI